MSETAIHIFMGDLYVDYASEDGQRFLVCIVENTPLQVAFSRALNHHFPNQKDKLSNRGLLRTQSSPIWLQLNFPPHEAADFNQNSGKPRVPVA